MNKRSKLAKQCVVDDTARTCRVCMKKDGPMKDLFDSDSKIVEEIEFCVGILITENENLPSSICHDCLAQLAVAHNFKTTCIHSNRTFQELLEDVKLEVKYEDDDDSSILVKDEIEYLYANDSVDDFVTDTVRKTRPKKAKVKTTLIQGDPKYRRLYCIKCDLHFKNRKESLDHFQTTHNNEKWICEICGKQYAHQSSHYAHVRTHGPSSHACALCDYSTSHKSDLDKHMLIHTNEKKFQCHICSKPFRTSSNLHGHIRRNHGGHKKHSCDRCDKKFYTLNRLKRHLDSHNNVKRFECEVCHARFTRRCHWKLHLQKQHAVSTPRLRPGKTKKSPVLQEKPSIFNK